VKALVETGKAEKLARNALTADRVLEEYRRLAFADIRTFFDADGNLKPIQDLDDDQTAGLASLEVIIKNAEAGDGHTTRSTNSSCETRRAPSRPSRSTSGWSRSVST
jgi:hypothetical protein